MATERLQNAKDFLRTVEMDGGHYTRDQIDAMRKGLSIATKFSHDLAKNSGWWNEYLAMPEEYRKYFLASKRELMHSELSEATEGARKSKADDHLPYRKAEEVELADTLIRIFDYAGMMGFDLSGAVIEKLAYNQQRADHKPEARAAEGGKSF